MFGPEVAALITKNMLTNQRLCQWDAACSTR